MYFYMCIWVHVCLDFQLQYRKYELFALQRTIKAWPGSIFTKFQQSWYILRQVILCKQLCFKIVLFQQEHTHIARLEKVFGNAIIFSRMRESYKLYLTLSLQNICLVFIAALSSDAILKNLLYQHGKVSIDYVNVHVCSLDIPNMHIQI